MAILSIPDEAELAMANRAFGKIANGNLTAKLFKSNTTIMESSTTNDFTECTADNYLPVTITPAQITVDMALDGRTRASFSANFESLTSAPEQTVCGIKIEDATGVLLGVDRYSVAKVLGAEPQTLNHDIELFVG